MPRRANTQTQQEAVQENAAVQADAGADMQMEAAITKTQPEKGVLALADVKIGDFMTIRMDTGGIKGMHFICNSGIRLW